jgi:hypothetical protein
MTRLPLVALLLVVTGCGRYWVEERTLDAYAGLPRVARPTAVVPATRVRDGAPAFIRGGDARPEPVTDGTRRRVRVLRPLTVAGLALLGVGTAWLATGAGMMGAGLSCQNPEPVNCDVRFLVPSIVMLIAGGAELTIGAVLTDIGATSAEVPRLPDRFHELRF